MSAPPLHELTAALLDASRGALALSGEDSGEWIDAPPGCERLLDGLRHAAWLKDYRLRFVAANWRFCESIGQAEAHVLGQSDFDCFPRELAEEHRAADRRVLAAGAPLQQEETRLVGGRLVRVRVVKAPVQDSEGRVVGVLGIYADALPDDPGEGARAAGALPPVAPSAPPRRTVLLADDEPVLLSLGEAVLRRHGFDVLVASDGREAVERYRSAGRRIDLVVLDRTMPNLSGREALRELSVLDPGVAVLFVSGFAPEQLTDEERARTRGFLAKPYTPQGLVAAVREALASGT